MAPKNLDGEPDLATLGGRLSAAHAFLTGRLRRAKVTLTDLATRVGEAHGQRRFTAGQMTEYQNGTSAPPLDVLLAYARACQVDPGWLTFGAYSAAPAPPGYEYEADSVTPPAPAERVDSTPIEVERPADAPPIFDANAPRQPSGDQASGPSAEARPRGKQAKGPPPGTNPEATREPRVGRRRKASGA